LAHKKLVLILTLGLACIFAAVSVAATPTPEQVYRASLAYTQCMRAHGVPQPNPDHTGNIHLTPADEAALRKIGRTKVQATDKLCFDLHLKGVVSTKPLSAYAQSQALVVLRELKGCLKSYGFTVGKPLVHNLTRGRAFFGFEPSPPPSKADKQRLINSEHTCEKRLQMDKRIDAIVKADRAPV
jgi:hypothetical protein